MLLSVSTTLFRKNHGIRNIHVVEKAKILSYLQIQFRSDLRIIFFEYRFKLFVEQVITPAQRVPISAMELTIRHVYPTNKYVMEYFTAKKGMMNSSAVCICSENLGACAHIEMPIMCLS